MYFKKRMIAFILSIYPSFIIPFSVTHYDSWSKVHDLVDHAVAHVYVSRIIKNIFEPYKSPKQSTATGSAFFVNIEKNGKLQEGYLLTNFHVVDCASSISIAIPFLGKERFKVDVLYCRPERDTALLRLTPDSLKKLKGRLESKEITYLSLGDSDRLIKTQEVMALGFPLTEEGLKITIGTISGKERVDGKHCIQITAPINFGNSGGPTVDGHGCVVGINTSGILFAQNAAYMIPINDIKGMIDKALSSEWQGKTYIERRPTLGFFVEPTDEDVLKYLCARCTGGVYVTRVIQGSSPEKAGLMQGDVIYQLNGYALDSFGYSKVPWCQDKVFFLDILDRLEVGDTVTMTVDRGGVTVTLTFELDGKGLYAIDEKYMPYEEVSYEVLGGLTIMELTMNHLRALFGRNIEQIRNGYVQSLDPTIMQCLLPDYRVKPRLMVTNVFPDSLAEHKSLEIGSIITKVNGKDVSTLDDFRAIVRKDKALPFLTIEMESGDLAAFPVKSLCEDENRLSSLYFYTKSSLVHELASA